MVGWLENWRVMLISTQVVVEVEVYFSRRTGDGRVEVIIMLLFGLVPKLKIGSKKRTRKMAVKLPKVSTREKVCYRE